MITRPALVALKFLSATSLTRRDLDKMQDVVDLGHTIERSFTDADLAEARRIVAASNPPAADDGSSTTSATAAKSRSDLRFDSGLAVVSNGSR